MLCLIVAVTLRWVATSIKRKENIEDDGIVEFTLLHVSFIIGVQEVFIIKRIDHILVDRFNVGMQYGEDIEVAGRIIISIAVKHCRNIHLTRSHQGHLTCLGVNGSDVSIR